MQQIKYLTAPLFTHSFKSILQGLTLFNINVQIMSKIILAGLLEFSLLCKLNNNCVYNNSGNTMQSKIQNQTNPLRKLLFFGLYSFSGFTLLSYFAYRGFKQAANKMKVERVKGQMLRLSKMRSFPGLKKAMLVSGLYFIGFAFFSWNLNITDRVFHSTIRKDKQFTDKVKLDPFFQDFYIIKTMSYFGISEKLIKKTEQQLKEKLNKNQGEKMKQGVQVGFEKSMLSLAEYIGRKKD